MINKGELKMNDVKIAKELVKLAKSLIESDFHKDISNQFKSLSREVSKPNNTKNISKGLNNLSNSFKKMPKMSNENDSNDNTDDIVAALTEIANDLLKEEE